MTKDIWQDIIHLMESVSDLKLQPIAPRMNTAIQTEILLQNDFEVIHLWCSLTLSITDVNYLTVDTVSIL